MNDYIKGLDYERPHPFRVRTDGAVEDFNTNITIENGVVRWKSNGEVLPKDLLKFWLYIGKEFDYELCIKTQEKEKAEFFKRYAEREVNRKPSNEEIHGMRAAFGEGTTVVNVITGRKTQL